MLFGKTRLASTAHMWLPNIREYSSKEALPSFILKQYNRVPWLVPLTVYPCCLTNSPGRLGPIGHRIPGFLIARLLQSKLHLLRLGRSTTAHLEHNINVSNELKLPTTNENPHLNPATENSHMMQIPTEIKGSSLGNDSLNSDQKVYIFLHHTAKLCL